MLILRFTSNSLATLFLDNFSIFTNPISQILLFSESFNLLPLGIFDVNLNILGQSLLRPLIDFFIDPLLIHILYKLSQVTPDTFDLLVSKIEQISGLFGALPRFRDLYVQIFHGVIFTFLLHHVVFPRVASKQFRFLGLDFGVFLHQTNNVQESAVALEQVALRDRELAFPAKLCWFQY